MAKQKQSLNPEDNQEVTIIKDIATDADTTELPAENQEIDGNTLNVLKAFPLYEFLYVDKRTGSYSPDTPKAIRGNATLYKNPYFKKP
ncbi:hypothetical protein POZ03_01475 [Bacteroides uniformis]|uniref:hypothetical protein n=1 Tax=Bacteroides uniformis TaxID=820 RepID=UPI00233F5E1B|nr:hypothetical protein [Bacteroides uniformis]MDC1809127.1 hypothetical protein [Bacteroides uniformis]